MSDRYEIWHAKFNADHQKCSMIKNKNKKIKIQDGRRHHNFFVPRDSALVKRVDRFWQMIRQNACFGTGSCLLGFRKINVSVFTPKIAKNPICWTLSMHFLRKTKMLPGQ